MMGMTPPYVLSTAPMVSFFPAEGLPDVNVIFLQNQIESQEGSKF